MGGVGEPYLKQSLILPAFGADADPAARPVNRPFLERGADDVGDQDRQHQDQGDCDETADGPRGPRSTRAKRQHDVPMMI